MKYTYTELQLKSTEFHLPSGKVLNGPKQALGSLYKEYRIEDKVFKFYLYQANKEAFVYKYLGTRKIESWDKKLPSLLKLVD